MLSLPADGRVGVEVGSRVTGSSQRLRWTLAGLVALALAAPFENEFNRNFALNNLMLGSIYLGAGAYGPAMVPLRRAGKVMAAWVCMNPRSQPSGRSIFSSR
mgnify:CR=1 FL=1